MVVDHTCRNRGCVNPAHLRQVSNRTNLVENSEAIAAVNVVKSHCKRGHPLTGEHLTINKNGTRRCRTCDALLNGERNRRRRHPEVPPLEIPS